MYLAPEIINNKSYKKTVDFWNYGIFVYEMLIGENPFESESKIQNLFVKIKNVDFKIPTSLSAEAADLVKKLLIADPEKRLGSQSIDEIKSHVFFKGVDWDDVLLKRQKGMLSPKFDKEESLMKSLSVNIFNQNQNEKGVLHLKGFSFREKPENIISNDELSE